MNTRHAPQNTHPNPAVAAAQAARDRLVKLLPDQVQLAKRVGKHLVAEAKKGVSAQYFDDLDDLTLMAMAGPKARVFSIDELRQFVHIEDTPGQVTKTLGRVVRDCLDAKSWYTAKFNDGRRLTYEEADEVAVKLGTHPANVWTTWSALALVPPVPIPPAA